jgi:hypothetical protein
MMMMMMPPTRQLIDYLLSVGLSLQLGQLAHSSPDILPSLQDKSKYDTCYEHNGHKRKIFCILAMFVFDYYWLLL